MSKEKFSALFKGLSKGLKRHSPEILTGIGIAGMIGAVVMAVKATPKAMELINEKKSDTDKLTVTETVKTTWKCYIPTAVTGILGIACIVGASSVNLKRNAALAAAYGLTETAFKEYRDKAVQLIGEKKDTEIKDAIAKDKIEKNPVSSSEIIITEKGNTLCYEPLSGRYFKSDMDVLKKAENKLNAQMLQFDFISLNDLYYEIGLGETSIGELIGWNIQRTGYIDFAFSSQLAEDGTPCLVVGHNTPPVYDL